MPPKGYRSVSLPEKLLDEIVDLIKCKNLSYRNPTEFIIDAIRTKLRYEEGKVKGK